MELSSDLGLEIDFKKIHYKSEQFDSSKLIYKLDLEMDEGFM